MNQVARLWRDHKAGLGYMGVAQLGIVRQAFIAGCEAMRGDMNVPNPELRWQSDQDHLELMGQLRLVPGADDE